MEFMKRTHIYKHNTHYILELDVYLPINAARRLPAVIYFHGGALIFGDRAGINPNELAAILGAGMAYISIDYRLAPETKLMDIARDVEDAIRWVREEGARIYGFDANRIAAMGKSAGGYLALLSGTFPGRPRAIVSFYGYGDILGDWYSCPSSHYLQRAAVPQDEADRCLVAGIPTHSGYGERWPLYLRARQTGTWASLVSGYDPHDAKTALLPYCPIATADAQFPPTLLLHGSADTDVPITQSEDMYATLTGLGIHAQLRIFPEADHMFDEAWSNTPDEFGCVIRFLEEVL